MKAKLISKEKKEKSQRKYIKICENFLMLSHQLNSHLSLI